MAAAVLMNAFESPNISSIHVWFDNGDSVPRLKVLDLRSEQHKQFYVSA